MFTAAIWGARGGWSVGVGRALAFRQQTPTLVLSLLLHGVYAIPPLLLCAGLYEASCSI